MVEVSLPDFCDFFQTFLDQSPDPDDQVGCENMHRSIPCTKMLIQPLDLFHIRLGRFFKENKFYSHKTNHLNAQSASEIGPVNEP
jgi:hypothetical protein